MAETKDINRIKETLKSLQDEINDLRTRMKNVEFEEDKGTSPCYGII